MIEVQMSCGQEHCNYHGNMTMHNGEWQCPGCASDPFIPIGMDESYVEIEDGR
mgnify:CR=1 FL=1